MRLGRAPEPAADLAGRGHGFDLHPGNSGRPLGQPKREVAQSEPFCEKVFQLLWGRWWPRGDQRGRRLLKQSRRKVTGGTRRQLKGERKNQQARAMGGSGGGVRSQGRHPGFWRQWGLATWVFPFASDLPPGSRPGLPLKTSLHCATQAPDPPVAPCTSSVTCWGWTSLRTCCLTSGDR